MEDVLRQIDKFLFVIKDRDVVEQREVTDTLLDIRQAIVNRGRKGVND